LFTQNHDIFQLFTTVPLFCSHAKHLSAGIAVKHCAGCIDGWLAG